MKIVSLLPSATELVCGLGLRDQLVGVSHECDYPPSVVGLPILTSSRIPEGLTSDEIDRLVSDQLQNDQALYDLIMHTLNLCGNNHAEAAKKLGIARSSLYRKLNEFDFGE